MTHAISERPQAPADDRARQAANAVKSLADLLGPATARQVILNALCERRTDEPTPWLDGADLTDQQHDALRSLCRRVNILDEAGVDPSQIVRLADGAEGLDGTRDTAEIADWFDDGAVLLPPTIEVDAALATVWPFHVVVASVCHAGREIAVLALPWGQR